MIAYFYFVGLPLAAALLLLRWLPLPMAGLLGSGVTLLLFFLHEFRTPGSMHNDQKTFRRDIVIAALSGTSGQIVILTALYMAALLKPEAISWKLLYQVPVVVVISDFLGYWSHWLTHRIPPLWSIHVLHHSPKRLYWLNGLRSHPFDSIWTNLVIGTWAIFLGFSFESLVLAGIVVLCHLQLQHSTVRLPAWLGLLFATPEWHIRHHDLAAGGRPVNLGRIFSFWDRLFGTARPSQAIPEKLGVTGLGEMTLTEELGLPFHWQRIGKGRIEESQKEISA